MTTSSVTMEHVNTSLIIQKVFQIGQVVKLFEYIITLFKRLFAVVMVSIVVQKALPVRFLKENVNKETSWLIG